MPSQIFNPEAHNKVEDPVNTSMPSSVASPNTNPVMPQGVGAPAPVANPTMPPQVQGGIVSSPTRVPPAKTYPALGSTFSTSKLSNDVFYRVMQTKLARWGDDTSVGVLNAASAPTDKYVSPYATHDRDPVTGQLVLNTKKQMLHSFDNPALDTATKLKMGLGGLAGLGTGAMLGNYIGKGTGALRRAGWTLGLGALGSALGVHVPHKRHKLRFEDVAARIRRGEIQL